MKLSCIGGNNHCDVIVSYGGMTMYAGSFPPAVSPRGDKHSRQRPRSSTAPGVHFDLPESPDGEGRERVGKRVKLKRRSYSAVSARSVNTHHLLKTMLVSRHTGLVPQKFKSLETSSTSEAASNPSVHPPSNRGKAVLPPVVQHGELGMKIEVKGLRGTLDASNDGPSPNTPKRVTESYELLEIAYGTQERQLSRCTRNDQECACSYKVFTEVGQCAWMIWPTTVVVDNVSSVVLVWLSEF